MLPLQGAVFGGIYNPGRCPGLSDVALSGRWIGRLADASLAGCLRTLVAAVRELLQISQKKDAAPSGRSFWRGDI